VYLIHHTLFRLLLPGGRVTCVSPLRQYPMHALVTVPPPTSSEQHHHFLFTVCLFCPAYLRLHPWQPNWAASHVSQRMLGRWQHKSHHWAVCMCLHSTCTSVLHTAEAHRCVSRSIAGVSPAGAGRQINPSRHLTPTVPTAEETEGPGLSSYPDC
jgi:hypothetical protein